jgi:hypothetical protein
MKPKIASPSKNLNNESRWIYIHARNETRISEKNSSPFQELQKILECDPREFPSMNVHQLVLKFCHIEHQFCLPKTSEVKPQDKNKLTHFWIIMMIAILRNNLFKK